MTSVHSLSAKAYLKARPEGSRTGMYTPLKEENVSEYSNLA